MNKAVKVLIIILFVILLLCAAGAAGVPLWRNSGTAHIIDGNGTTKEIPSIRTGLPEIPDDAVLHSLNWGQSASNEYECFVFNLSRDEDGCYISGKYVVPENDRHIERENLPLADEQWHSIEQCLRGCRHSPPPIRHDNETIYDETGSSLSVCWKTADGGSLSVKYDGRGEEALCELLKSLLSGSAEEES